MNSHEKFNIDQLEVFVHSRRSDMGAAAARNVSTLIKEIAVKQGEVRIVFAAAASQREFLNELLRIPDVPWDKIVAFQMDEYHTLPETATQRFGNFLNKLFFQFKDFKEVHYMTSDTKEYEQLISSSQIDIVCLGIGENGHLAFNDPPVADFDDKKIIKEVKLDEVCRQQQVNDEEFKSIEEVPEYAITLTIPTLVNATHLSVVVPGSTKAKAVENTIFKKIDTEYPSTILRKHKSCKLFLDTDSAIKILDRLS